MNRGSLRWLVIALVVIAGRALLPSGLARDLAYLAFGIGAVVVAALGIRRNRPTVRLPWLLLVVGLGCWVAGDLLWTVFDHVLHIDPFPSVADVVYLAAYPLYAVGLNRLSKARNPGGDPIAMLDAALVGVIAFASMWVLTIGPAFESPETDFFDSLIGSAYPIGDVILLVQLTYLAGDTRFRSTALRMIGVALAATLVADVLFQGAGAIAWIDDSGTQVEWLWLTGYALIALGAADRSMAAATLPQVRPTMTARAGIGKLAFLLVALLALPGTALVQWIGGDDPDSVELAGAGMLVIVLAIVRMSIMTRQLVTQADRLAVLAEADVLTGLPNLRRFTSEVGARLGDGGREVPVLLVVLDRFAEINETLGHRVGDELLCAVADRMTGLVGDKGLVARLGGDTFGVVVHDVGRCLEDITVGAAYLRDELGAPFTLSDVSVSVDAYVGVVVGPDDGATVAELLQRADVALSAARGRADRVARYSGRMSSDGALTPHLMSELSAALDNGEFVLHYQPQVEIATGRVHAVEALVRWQHPVHGLLAPAAFIPAAERTGLIRPLTLYVLDRALSQVARWRMQGRSMTVSVNMSARDLLDPAFVDDVELALRRNGLDTGALELEITETMAMVDPNRALQVLAGLAGLGVILAVDDYGTGYSSLAYLQRLPVQRLKIDRSFVLGVVDDAPSAAIVRSTIELARNLGMSVVAEGVEDDATLMTLRDMGCEAAQGFGLGRPVPADKLPMLIETIETRVPRVLRQTVAVGQRVV